MHNFITNFLNKNFESFKNRTLSQEDLCSLRTFESNNFNPDYSNIIHREFYYLKYSSFYISEYYLIFKHIFEQEFLLPGGDISVLSIGCGAMLDLVGFEYARRDTQQFQNATPHYYGIDISDWKCDSTKIINSLGFYKGCVSTFDLRTLGTSFDIIIFPKVMSDIGLERIFNFSKNIINDNLYKKSCIINSRRGESNTDSELAALVCGMVMYNTGCGCIKDSVPMQKAQATQYIEKLLPKPFSFDDNVGSFIRKLPGHCEHKSCAHNDDMRAKENCSEIIGRWPMRYAKACNISPEIYYLEKQQ